MTSLFKMVNLKSIFFLVILFPILTCLSASSVASAQTCSKFTFPDSASFSTCTDLPALNSSLHWTYYPSSHSVDIAYRHASDSSASSWAAWALNLEGKGMIGAQSLVAYQDSDGVVRAYTTAITGYDTRLKPGGLSLKVPRIRAEIVGGEIIIYATLQLPQNRTSFNQVWQAGRVRGGTLLPHSMKGDSMKAMSKIDFRTGLASPNTADRQGDSRQLRKIVHGVLNVVSWGVMMPIGVILARYVRAFNPRSSLWFYLHIVCQISGYLVGVAGWALGVILGGDSPGVTHTSHRNLGITIFVLGTIQALSVFLRPKPEHKYRCYWNIYHRVVGCTVLALSIINIYGGIELMGIDQIWKWAYTGFLVLLVWVLTTLEVVSRLLRKKRAASDDVAEESSCQGV